MHNLPRDVVLSRSRGETEIRIYPLISLSKIIVIIAGVVVVVNDAIVNGN